MHTPRQVASINIVKGAQPRQYLSDYLRCLDRVGGISKCKRVPLHLEESEKSAHPLQKPQRVGHPESFGIKVVPPADNLMHNLHVERFYKAQVINGLIAPAGGDGPIKTPVLRGVKDTPTYFHDGRLMTLDDSVEYFNLTKLTTQEKKDLVAFMLTL